jgi:hypothetical protein
MKFHTGNANIYTDADGNLMEAQMAPIQAVYVRSKFALAPAQ